MEAQSASKSPSARKRRVEFTLADPRQQDLIQRAARINGESQATFARRAVLEAARAALASADALTLAATKAHSEPLVFEGEAAEALTALLDNPPPLSPRMAKALAQVEAMARRPAPEESSE